MTRFIDLVKKRRSVRSYRPDPVPREMIVKCVEAARYAPTACDTQSWRFIVVEGEMKERLIRESLGGLVVPNRWASSAPTIVVIASSLRLVTHRIGGGMKGIGYHWIDTGIAGEHFVLQAAELGLGTCWIGWFDKKAAKKLLDLPGSCEVTSMLAVGFPAEEPLEKKRRTVDEIVTFRDGERGE